MSRRVLVQVIGRAESALRGKEDLHNVGEAIKRIGGGMLAAVAATFESIEHPATEQGGGLGEWDCGAFVDAADVPQILLTVQDRFRTAFKAGLLRWHVSVIDADTEAFTNPEAFQPEEHPAEVGRSNCVLCNEPIPSTMTTCPSCQKPLDMDPNACPNCGVPVEDLVTARNKVDVVSRMIAKALCPLDPAELVDLASNGDLINKAPAVVAEYIIDARRKRIIDAKLYKKRQAPG